jgi:hypothetical protein
MEERVAKIISLRKKNPCFTLQEIADITDCSRENVRLTLNRAGLRTKNITFGKNSKTCPNCGKAFKATSSKQIHCSRQCWQKSHSITIECLQCGTKFEKRFSDLILYPSHKRQGYQHNGEFCSHSCAMKHYWKNERAKTEQNA